MLDLGLTLMLADGHIHPSGATAVVTGFGIAKAIKAERERERELPAMSIQSSG